MYGFSCTIWKIIWSHVKDDIERKRKQGAEKQYETTITQKHDFPK